MLKCVILRSGVNLQKTDNSIELQLCQQFNAIRYPNALIIYIIHKIARADLARVDAL